MGMNYKKVWNLTVWTKTNKNTTTAIFYSYSHKYKCKCGYEQNTKPTICPKCHKRVNMIKFR